MEDNLQNTKTQTTVEMKKTDKIQNMNKKQNTDKKLKKLKRNQIQNTDNDNTDIDVSESRIGSFRINRTGIELIIGNVIYYILGQILILIFADRKLNVSVGFILGVVISVLMTVHMTIAIEQAMSFNERGADRHVKKTTAVRMILCFIALIAIGITHVGDIVAALFGVMALKVSAYLQPLTHKVLARKSTEKGR
ncbi:MAG: ATP synthase subunit I [Lachnospiraceae bacterium]|nr:ATP synthase subunit I [Lachnospiraceae bacterium]